MVRMLNHHRNAQYRRLTPWLLCLVFFIPWVSAQIIYAMRDRLKFNTVQTGTFLSPPLQIQSLPLYNSAWLGKWQIVYIKTQDEQANTHMLPILKQLHLALGKEQHRVAYQMIPAPKSNVLMPGDIAIIDPRGWLILQYQNNANPIGILKDIRKLLRHSHGG
jgi:hypothetical protein